MAIGNLPASLHQHRPVKSLFALKVIANPGDVSTGAFADFPEMGSVKTSLSEQFASNLKNAVARWQSASWHHVRPLSFSPLPGYRFHRSGKFFRALTKCPPALK